MYKLFINLINLLELSCTYFSSKLSNIVLTLVSFNSIDLNIVILVIMFLLLFQTSKLYLYAILTAYLYTDKLSFLPFLNSFLLGFFKTHTPLFYVSVLVYFLIVCKNFISLKLKIDNKLMITLVSFLLGSFWALYLYSWGYYWSNDSIEYVLLFVIFNYILIIHKFQEHVLFTHIGFISIICLILLIRANLIYTKHSFFEINILPYVMLKFGVLLLLNMVFVIHYRPKHLVLGHRNVTNFYYCIVLMVIFNIINVITFKSLICDLAYILIFFILLTINWSTIGFLSTHILILFVMFVFTYYCIYYLLSFILKTTFIKINSHNLYTKSIQIYTYQNYRYIAEDFENLYNKSINYIKNENIKNLYYYKKLLNFFI